MQASIWNFPYYIHTWKKEDVSKRTLTSVLSGWATFMTTSGIPRTLEGWKFSWYALQLVARSKGDTKSSLRKTLQLITTSSPLSDFVLNKAVRMSSSRVPPFKTRLGPSSTMQGESPSLGFTKNLKSNVSTRNQSKDLCLCQLILNK